MSSELLNNKAFELAKALVNTSESVYTNEYQTTDGEIILVIVVSGKDKKRAAEKSIDESRRYIPIASGNPCPTCNGTGRI